jgi:hypothetical protein
MENLVQYLGSRAEASAFLLPVDTERSLASIFPRPDLVLPEPYKIFFSEETLPPILGFPVAECAALKELETKLDRWLDEEISWNAKLENSKDRSQLAFTAYFNQLIKLAENAMLSSLLADYHGVFWLIHSYDLSRHFSNLHKRVIRLTSLDATTARAQAETVKYRLFTKWANEARDQMLRMASRVSNVLNGEEERGLQFYRILQENVLILTEEFIGPDLRELKSYVTGYLHRDFNIFRETFERIRNVANNLCRHDRVFRGALSLMGVKAEQEVSMGLLMDSRFHRFLFEHPQLEKAANREERDQFQLVAKHLSEFAVLHQLRRGITWMACPPGGDIVSFDKRPEVVYSRSTRPIDFGRPGVVDPMVHRFGLMYDITAFSETLGDLARGGRKGELSSFRQMLVFQRKLETIADHHRLQFEKFLGDGAFYTTRRAVRLIKAAVEVQRCYAEMREKGFAFNKGLRVALNFGYYRLLPMKGGSFDGTDRLMEFYGPGVVELSRLTTGKASKEIEEIQGFLVAHGYEAAKVQQFFAPLARGVDVIDHKMHEREFYAYVNATAHLVNEGIVASVSLLQELSAELIAESHQLFDLTTPWGSYLGFSPGMEGVKYIGVRLIGTVSLKGLANVEVGEIVPFREGEVESEPVTQTDSLVTLLRANYHSRSDMLPVPTEVKTQERVVERELVLCTTAADDGEAEVFVMGEWDPLSDEIHHSIEIPRIDLQHLLGRDDLLSAEILEQQKLLLHKIYSRMSSESRDERTSLGSYRRASHFVGFLIGDRVQPL